MAKKGPRNHDTPSNTEAQNDPDLGSGLHPNVRPPAGQEPRASNGRRSAKLATREGFTIVEWFTDEAITGDSSTEARAGLAALLTAAKAGKFKVVLAWHTNRISREDPMDAVVFYNQLRKAGVGLHTCCEGAIDLDSFAKQLLAFRQPEGQQRLLDRAIGQVAPGKIATPRPGAETAKAVLRPGPRPYSTQTGHLVRRLLPGEHVHMAGHRVQLLPSTDKTIDRRGTVRVSASSMPRTSDFGIWPGRWRRRAHPSPTGRGWTHENLGKLFKTAAYVGTARMGNVSAGEIPCLPG